MLCCERAWLDSESADTVRINLITKDVKENVVASDAKECTTPSAARERVRCKRKKSVDGRRRVLVKEAEGTTPSLSFGGRITDFPLDFELALAN